MDQTRCVGRAAVAVFLLLAMAPTVGAQTIPAHFPGGMVLNLEEHAGAVPLTRITGPRPVSRALTGGAKIVIGAGAGFALLAVPAYIGTKDGKYTMAAGATGALLGAAVVWNLLR